MNYLLIIKWPDDSVTVRKFANAAKVNETIDSYQHQIDAYKGTSYNVMVGNSGEHYYELCRNRKM